MNPVVSKVFRFAIEGLNEGCWTARIGTDCKGAGIEQGSLDGMRRVVEAKKIAISGYAIRKSNASDDKADLTDRVGGVGDRNGAIRSRAIEVDAGNRCRTNHFKTPRGDGREEDVLFSVSRLHVMAQRGSSPSPQNTGPYE